MTMYSHEIVASEMKQLLKLHFSLCLWFPSYTHTAWNNEKYLSRIREEVFLKLAVYICYLWSILHSENEQVDFTQTKTQKLE